MGGGEPLMVWGWEVVGWYGKGRFMEIEGKSWVVCVEELGLLSTMISGISSSESKHIVHSGRWDISESIDAWLTEAEVGWMIGSIMVSLLAKVSIAALSEFSGCATLIGSTTKVWSSDT